jgi:hypothetical protein
MHSKKINIFHLLLCLINLFIYLFGFIWIYKLLQNNNIKIIIVYIIIYIIIVFY